MSFLDGKLFGAETEFFLINDEGDVINKADEVLNTIKLKHTELKKECGHSMIEIATKPHISSNAVFTSFLDDLETVLSEFEKKDIGLYYYGTYPGKNGNLMRSDKRYAIKEKILGKKQFLHAGRCIGFHFHHSLPNNVFDPVLKFFHDDLTMKQKQKMTNLHNFFVSLDPVITTLMQSSPYYEGKLYGKDARLMFYRGSNENIDYLYSKHPMFGSLNNYHNSFDTILQSIQHRFETWNNMLFENNSTKSDFAKNEPSLLDSSWKPVKLTAHGTIESRGGDMNSMSRVLATSIFLKHASRLIIETNLDVVPTKGITKFHIEDGTIYVPEKDKIKELEKKSAEAGFDNKELMSYCKSAMAISKNFNKDIRHNISILNNSIEEEETMSDKLINFVKKKQKYTDTIEKDTAREFALSQHDKLFKDIILTKKHMEYYQ